MEKENGYDPLPIDSKIDISTITEPETLLLHQLASESSDISTENFFDKIHKHKSSVFGASMNFTNSILGAGIMGLPYAMSRGGFGMTILLLALLTGIVGWSVIILIKCGKITGTDSYQAMVKHTFGLPGYYLISFFQFSLGFGGMCAYLIIITDNITSVLSLITDNEIITGRFFVLTTSTLVAVLPISLVKNLSKISKASTLSILALVFLIFIVAVEGPLNSTPPSDDKWKFVKPNVVQAIGVISFAFVCHHNSFMIFRSLKLPSIDGFQRVRSISLGISLVASLALTIPAYLSFTNQTQSNILNNFANDNAIVAVGRVIFAIVMWLTYPMEMFVAREVIYESFFKIKTKNENMRHIFITILLCSCTYFIALLFGDNLGVVLELTGGVSACGLAFTFPAASYYKLTQQKWYEIEMLMCVALFLFGLAAIILTVFLTVYNPF